MGVLIKQMENNISKNEKHQIIKILKKIQLNLNSNTEPFNKTT